MSRSYLPSVVVAALGAGFCAFIGCASSEDLTVAPPADSGAKDTSVSDAGGDSLGVDSSKPDGGDSGGSDAAADAVDGGDAKSDVPCDKSVCSGVCVDTTSDPTNCGACGTKCTGTEACIAGKCVACDAPLKKCSGVCVDTSADPANCGDCGTACSGGKKCIKGTCVCETGTFVCSGKCVDVFTDKDNCGSCGKACGAGETCVLAACEKPCLPPSTKCGSCTDTTKDPANCGACGKVCGTGETCVSGVCGCGGKVCTSAESCVSGVCTCKAGTKLCGASCIDVLTDPLNCGTCAKVCSAPTATCSGGTCVGIPKCNGPNPRVLMYKPLGVGLTTSLPTGSVVTTVDGPGWSALTSTDFASYQLIVFGDEAYSAVSTDWDPIAASKAKWYPVIGRVFVHTFDPVAHTGTTGTVAFSKASLQWTASGPGTGLYVGPDYGTRKLDFLNSFGAWTVLGQKTDGTAGDDVTVNLASHGSMVGSSSSSLSSWGYSYHGAISSFPAGFDKVASVTSTGNGLVVAKDAPCAP